MNRLLALIVVLGLGGCYRARLIKSPNDETPASVNAPMNANSVGQVRYLEGKIFDGTDGRELAEGLMHDACRGPYKIEFEIPDQSGAPLSDSWTVVNFSCVAP